MKPYFQIGREGLFATVTSAGLEKSLISLTITENMDAEADEAEILFENRDMELIEFFSYGGEYFITGGYQNQVENFGAFTMDEFDAIGPPDVLSVKALATDTVKPKIKTKKTVAWENTTLKRILEQKAQENGLRLVTSGRTVGISLLRVDQKEQTDLQFLKQLGKEWGFAVQIKNRTLFFEDRDLLEKVDPVLSIVRGESHNLRSHKLRWKSHQTYGSSKYTYLDPEKNEMVIGEVSDQSVQSAQTLVGVVRAETKEQAMRKAWAKLRARNLLKVEGTIELLGEPTLHAKMNITLANIHPELDGVYQIKTAKHTWSRSGYLTALDIQKVG